MKPAELRGSDKAHMSAEQQPRHHVLPLPVRVATTASRVPLPARVATTASRVTVTGTCGKDITQIGRIALLLICVTILQLK